MAQEKPTDSVTHHEERREKIRVEAAEQQQLAAKAEEQREHSRVEQSHATREAEDQELTRQVALIQHGETRDMLLERIRKLRELQKPAEEEEQPVVRPPELQKRFEAEQQAGREAVARFLADQERNRELQRKYEEEERLRQAPTETVYHPNPGQNEVYPTSKPK
jgi:hypothetical protein